MIANTEEQLPDGGNQWMSPEMKSILMDASDIFREEGLDDHQWEAFFMGFCAACNVDCPLPIPERV